MNKIAKLTKIANHLNSLGLTREADVLDNIIRKIAADVYVPDGQKYIDAYGSELLFKHSIWDKWTCDGFKYYIFCSTFGFDCVYNCI